MLLSWQCRRCGFVSQVAVIIERVIGGRQPVTVYWGMSIGPFRGIDRLVSKFEDRWLLKKVLHVADW